MKFVCNVMTEPFDSRKHINQKEDKMSQNKLAGILSLYK